jgi:hypothetical protein
MLKSKIELGMPCYIKGNTVRYESPQSTKKFSAYYQKPLSHFKIFITTCTSIDIIKYENQIAFNVKMSMFQQYTCIYNTTDKLISLSSGLFSSCVYVKHV